MWSEGCRTKVKLAAGRSIGVELAARRREAKAGGGHCWGLLVRLRSVASAGAREGREERGTAGGGCHQRWPPEPRRHAWAPPGRAGEARAGGRAVGLPQAPPRWEIGREIERGVAAGTRVAAGSGGDWRPAEVDAAEQLGFGRGCVRPGLFCVTMGADAGWAKG